MGQVVVSSGSEKNSWGERSTTTKRQQKFKLQYVSKGGIAGYLWIRNDTYVEYSPRFPPPDFSHFLSRKLWGWSGCWNLRLLYEIPSLNKNLVRNEKMRSQESLSLQVVPLSFLTSLFALQAMSSLDLTTKQLPPTSTATNQLWFQHQKSTCRDFCLGFQP